uniref:Putative pyridoxamine 5'-phosphate oxidase n=1 Tax=Thermosporothrix sp. COM3 TaxID=2490863 RepID=A0A455SX89_9CHLR|nr:putative pyridoxamine 5'-phosphate oxidase [Thermosporothrix sp. COM3]
MIDINNPKVQKILNSKALAHLATLGPDGAPQSSPMWFLWDGEYIKFTHTKDRKKYANIRRDPRVAISINDLDNPYIHAEFRGVVERIEEDPDASLFNELAERYGMPWRNPGDPRVVLYVRVQHITGQNLK